MAIPITATRTTATPRTCRYPYYGNNYGGYGGYGYGYPNYAYYGSTSPYDYYGVYGNNYGVTDQGLASAAPGPVTRRLPRRSRKAPRRPPRSTS